MAPPAPMTSAPLPYPNYPRLQVTHSLILFVACFQISGVATMLAGAVGGKSLLWKGIWQLLLTPLLVGIIWAIVSQYRLLRNATAST